MSYPTDQQRLHYAQGRFTYTSDFVIMPMSTGQNRYPTPNRMAKTMRLSSNGNVLLPLIAYYAHSVEEITEKTLFNVKNIGMKTQKSQFVRKIKFWRAENIIRGTTAEPLNLTSLDLAAAALSSISLNNGRITHNTNEMHKGIKWMIPQRANQWRSERCDNSWPAGLAIKRNLFSGRCTFFLLALRKFFFGFA